MEGNNDEYKSKLMEELFKSLFAHRIPERFSECAEMSEIKFRWLLGRKEKKTHKRPKLNWIDPS